MLLNKGWGFEAIVSRGKLSARVSRGGRNHSGVLVVTRWGGSVGWHATSSSVFKGHWNWWLSHTLTNSRIRIPVLRSWTSLQYAYSKAFIDTALRVGTPMATVSGPVRACGFYYCIFTLSWLFASTLFTRHRTQSRSGPLFSTYLHTLSTLGIRILSGNCKVPPITSILHCFPFV